MQDIVHFHQSPVLAKHPYSTSVQCIRAAQPRRGKHEVLQPVLPTARFRRVTAPWLECQFAWPSPASHI